MSPLRLVSRTLLPTRQHPTLLRTFHTTRPLYNSNAVLSNLQPDLKTAMRSKDKPRLTVLRALLAEITNASKTTSPVASDPAFYSLLQKQIKASRAAVEEFSAVKREDLVEKEQTQIAVLEEYVSKIDVVGEEECEKAVNEVVEAEKSKDEAKWAKLEGKARAGIVMGKTKAKIGDRAVDMKMLKDVIEKVVAA